VNPTTLVFVDSNIPLYATGGEHQLREPCRQIIRRIAAQPSRFLTSAEVLQEMLHHFLRVKRWPQAQFTLNDFIDLMAGRIEAVTSDDVWRAGEMASDRPGIESRDYVHCAVMGRVGALVILSADAGFDRLPVRRIDPSKAAEQVGLLD
jgi:uncharacterized protein